MYKPSVARGVLRFQGFLFEGSSGFPASNARDSVRAQRIQGDIRTKKGKPTSNVELASIFEGIEFSITIT